MRFTAERRECSKRKISPRLTWKGGCTYQRTINQNFSDAMTKFSYPWCSAARAWRMRELRYNNTLLNFCARFFEFSNPRSLVGFNNPSQVPFPWLELVIKKTKMSWILGVSDFSPRNNGISHKNNISVVDPGEGTPPHTHTPYSPLIVGPNCCPKGRKNLFCRPGPSLI